MKPSRGWFAAHAVLASIIVAGIGLLAVILVAVFVDTGEGFRNVSLVVAAVVAFPFLVWRTMIGVQQADGGDDGLLNERFQTAAQMIGHEVLAVRTAGAQAFGVLADDAPEKYHVQVLRLLCAFVRNPTPDAALPLFEPGGDVRLREDVQAAVGVIGRRKGTLGIESQSRYEPNLIDADLRGARLWGTLLERAICIRTDFEDARLGNVSFNDANLESASFVGAYLTGAGIDNPDAMENPATMRSAILAGVNFQGADLRGVDMSGADFACKRGRSLAPATEDAPARFERGEPAPAVGLTQTQLDHAVADPGKPPMLDGVEDHEGNQLTWRGVSPDQP